MVETVLCLPILLALTTLVIEAARLAALSLILQVATQDAARSVALRWVHIEQNGFEKRSVSNEADLHPLLSEALERDILGHVAAFPGYAASLSSFERTPPEGRFFFDKKGNKLTFRVHVCVPLMLFSLGRSAKEAQTLRSEESLDSKELRPKPRDCEGRFQANARGLSVRLQSKTSIELAANTHIFHHGLMLPEHVPLVNIPSPTLGLFAKEGAGIAPSWKHLFQETPLLFEKKKDPQSP